MEAKSVLEQVRTFLVVQSECFLQLLLHCLEREIAKFISMSQSTNKRRTSASSSTMNLAASCTNSSNSSSPDPSASTSLMMSASISSSSWCPSMLRIVPIYGSREDFLHELHLATSLRLLFITHHGRADASFLFLVECVEGILQNCGRRWKIFS